MHNYYQILNISPTATFPEIKFAYHSLLLKHHPDKSTLSKNHSSSLSNTESSSSSSSSLRIIDVSLLKEAYTTLSSALSRSQYDISLKNSSLTAVRLGPRPAQIVSLEDFTQLRLQEGDIWEYPCRCGGTYRISEFDMDKGQHLVGCRSCSEVIWVGYELVDEDDNGGQDD